MSGMAVAQASANETKDWMKCIVVIASVNESGWMGRRCKKSGSKANGRREAHVVF